MSVVHLTGNQLAQLGDIAHPEGLRPNGSFKIRNLGEDVVLASYENGELMGEFRIPPYTPGAWLTDLRR